MNTYGNKYDLNGNGNEYQYTNAGLIAKMIAFFNVFIKTPVKYILVLSILIFSVTFVELFFKYVSKAYKYSKKMNKSFFKSIKVKDWVKKILPIIMTLLYLITTIAYLIIAIFFILFIIILFIPLNFIILV